MPTLVAATVAGVIARTTTSTGVRVKAEVMKRIYHSGVKATKDFLAVNFILYDKETPKYNYQTINHQ